MQKLLTIVVPTFNMEVYLPRCLESLALPCDQMDLLEVLVINDGSTDGSSEIGHSFESRYPNTFRVIDKANGNYGSCINLGLQEAQGKYIKILDADDYFNKEVFGRFLSFLSAVDVDAVVSDFVEVDEQGTVTKQYRYQIPEGTWKLSDLPQCLDMWMHAITYQTRHLRQIGYKQTEGISYTDQEWIFWPMVAIKSISGFPEVLYQYLVGRQGQTVDIKVKSKNIWQEIQSFKAMIVTMNQLTDYGDAKDYLQTRLLGRARYIYRLIILGVNARNDELKGLDNYIFENNKELYYQLERITPRDDMRIRYVHLWRKMKNCAPVVRILWIMEKCVRKVLRPFNTLQWKSCCR